MSVPNARSGELCPRRRERPSPGREAGSVPAEERPNPGSAEVVSAQSSVSPGRGRGRARAAPCGAELTRVRHGHKSGVCPGESWVWAGQSSRLCPPVGALFPGRGAECGRLLEPCSRAEELSVSACRALFSGLQEEFAAACSSLWPGRGADFTRL